MSKQGLSSEETHSLEVSGIALTLVTAAVYFLLAELGHALSFPGDFATFWLPAGFAAATLYHVQFRGWAFVLTGMLIANLTSDVYFQSKPIPVSLGFWTANAVEAVIAAHLLRRFQKQSVLSQINGVLSFLFLPCIFATAAGATIGAAVVSSAFDAPYFTTWAVWWSTDAIGMAVVFPFISSLRNIWAHSTQSDTRPSSSVSVPEYVRFAVLFILQLVVTDYIFGRQHQRLAYVAYPLLIWLAVKHHRLGATSALLATAILVVYHSAAGRGLFGDIPDLNERAAVVQIFLTVATITVLVLSAAVHEQRRSEIDRRSTLNALNRRSKELNELFELLPMGLILADQNRNVIRVNGEFQNAFGYAADEVLGKSTRILYASEEDFERKGDPALHGDAGLATAPYIIKYRRKDGSEFDGETIARAIIGDDRKNIAKIGLIQDVTERIEREQELFDLKTQLKMAVEAGNIGLWGWNTDSDIVEYSDELHQQLGEELGTLSRLSDWEGRLHPDDVEKANQILTDTLAERRSSYTSTFRLMHADGSYRWILSRGRLFVDENNEPTRMVGTNTDITQLRETQEKLESYLHLMGTTDGAWNWDIATNDVSFSPRFRELLGFEGNDQKAIPGSLQALRERIHPDDVDGVWRGLEQHLREGHPFNAEFRLKHRDGHYRWFRSRGNTIRDDEESPLRMAGSIYDITEQKEAEQRLLESVADLEQFAYAASHDLQEPLRAITGFCQLLEQRYGDLLDERGNGYITNIVEGTERMRRLIMDLLDYSRVSRRPIQMETFDLTLCVDEAVQNLSTLIADTKAVISYSKLPEVTGHQPLLTALLQNLISNAIKFRKPDETPHVTIRGQPKDSTYVIEVEDNGIGISPRYHEQIFALFKRLHRREQIPGTGLGLAICRRIVDRHNGSIRVTSQDNAGAVFHISLPQPHSNLTGETTSDHPESVPQA